MRVVPHRTFFVDCDDTLILWDRSEYPEGTKVSVLGPRNDQCEVVLNNKNINTVKKLRKLGYYVVVWSHSGHEWAEQVVKTCGLEDFVDEAMSKPLFYMDDRKVEEWMGERIWRDAK